MSLIEKEELKLLWPFYIQTFLSKLFFIYPAFILIVLIQNFSLTQIGFLFTALALSSFIFEFPTGVLADIYGRKFSVLMGYFLQGFILILAYFTISYYGLIVIFFLWGLFGTLVTGAYESWVTDNLINKKKRKYVGDYFIKEHSLVNLGLFLSGLIGAYLVYLYGLDIVWILSGISYLLSGVILMFVKEYKVNFKKLRIKNDFFSQTKRTFSFIMTRKNIRYFIIALFFVSIYSIFSGKIIYQSLLLDLGFEEYYFGILFSFIVLIGVIVPYTIKGMKNKLEGEKNLLLFTLIILMLLSFLFLIVTNYIVAILLLSIIFFSYNIYNPLRKSYIQNFIPSKIRSSVNSFSASVLAIAIALSMPLAGYLGELIGSKFVMVISGLILIPAIYYYFKIKDK